MRTLIAGVVCGLAALSAAAGSALAQVVYVDAAAPAGGDGNSWGGAYQSIQTALSRARTSGGVTEVRVARGTYRPGTTGSRIVSFDLVGSVALRGGYAGVASATPDARDLKGTPTILTGDVNGDDIDGGGRGVRTDNLLHVVTASNLTTPAVLDGFHVRGGYGSGTGDQGAGSGVFVASCGANLVVSNCVIRDNYATGGPAGFFSRYTTPTLVNCLIVGNWTNTGSVGGGGVAGIVMDYSSMPGAPTMDHCVVAYNTAWLSNEGCSLPGGVAPNLASVRGCVFFGNKTTTFVNASPGQISGQYVADSSIASAGGNWAGTGSNKTGDPLFTDPAGLDGVVGSLDDDFRLRPDSPCIDSGGVVGADVADVDGDGDKVEATPLDADGSARIYDAPGVQGAGSDMGAIEGPALSAQPSAYALPVNERSSAGLTVRLSRPVTAPVTVTLAGDGLLPTPASLTFSPENWDTPRAVSVYGLSDADFLNTARSLRMTGPGLSAATVAVTVVDADTSPTMIFVNPQGTLPPDGFSWASGMRTIDAAVALADQWPAATQVWIKEGTYVPVTAGWPDPRSGRFFVRGGLTLVGGFAGNEQQLSERVIAAHPTVISGDFVGDDAAAWPTETDQNNCFNLVEFTSAEGETGLDGVTLRGARDVALVSNSVSVPAGAGNNLRLRNCRFERNRQGAVSWFTRGWFEASDCVFAFNGVNSPSRSPLTVGGEAMGGVVPLMRLTRCTFSDNRGEAGGAGLSWGRVEVADCRFERNTATGGNYVQGALVVSLTNVDSGLLAGSASVVGTRFEQNAGAYGSALSFYRQVSNTVLAVVMPASVSGCEFVGNTGTTAAAVWSNGNVTAAQGPTTITGCLFQGNTVTGEGGAINGLRCDSCTFRNNTAQRGGGAANAALVDCLLEANTATAEGGGAYRGSVLRCTLRNNSAPTGGGMTDSFTTASVVTASQSRFEGNHATNAAGSGGGGAYGVHAEDCVFVGNTSAADAGGGYVNAQRCRFAGNSAARSGGGAMGRLVSCLVTGNTAGVKGGGCFENEAIVNCTVAGNSAPTGGGAADVWYAENSILWGNGGGAGAVEQQQVTLKSGVSTGGSIEVQLGRLVSPGSAVSGVFNMPGPMTGGFVGPFDPVLLSTATAATPGMMPTYAVTAPVGHLGALVVGGQTKQSRWVSTQGPGGSTSGPSALHFVTNLSGGTDVAASVVMEATFAADGQLGDDTHAGVYLNGTGLPGTGGGGPTAQVTRSADLTDLLPPGQLGKLWFYNRNDSGFSGILAYVKITTSRPQVSSCIVQGLALLAGNGNLGSDPLFVHLVGTDGVLGTADDDGSLADGSPAFDSGNGRLVSVDKYDFDADGNRVERLLTDVNGQARVVDLPAVVDAGSGPLSAVDRGAVERTAPVCVADVGRAGGLPGADGVLDNNDFVVFIDLFFNHDPRGDVGSTGGVPGADGVWDNNDFVVFVDRFFAGC